MGPIFPPEMIWQRTFESLQPTYLTAQVPRHLNFDVTSPSLKRSWIEAFDKMDDFQWPIYKALEVARPMALLDLHKPVACKLSCEGVLEDETSKFVAATQVQSASDEILETEAVHFATTTQKQHGRRSKPPLVTPQSDFSDRRMTRSAAKLQGYKPTSAIPIKPRPPRQPHAKSPRSLRLKTL